MKNTILLISAFCFIAFYNPHLHSLEEINQNKNFAIVYDEQSLFYLESRILSTQNKLKEKPNNKQLQLQLDGLIEKKNNLPHILKELSSEMEFVYVSGNCIEKDEENIVGETEGGNIGYHCVESFYLGKYEVTKEQYKMLIDQNGASKRNDYPIANITFTEAKQFASKFSNRVGLKVRLPTQAEWEFACEKGIWENDSEAKNNLGSSDGYFSVSPVSVFYPNKLGIYGLLGNVSEWIIREEVSNSSKNDAYFIGGNFSTKGKQSCKKTVRQAEEHLSSDSIGFRLVLPID